MSHEGMEHKGCWIPDAGVDLQSPLKEGWVWRVEWREQGSPGTEAGREERRVYEGWPADKLANAERACWGNRRVCGAAHGGPRLPSRGAGFTSVGSCRGFCVGREAKAKQS